MHPNYTPAAKLTKQERHELSNTPLIKIYIGPSTLEQPLGTPVPLPLGLAAHYSPLLRRHFTLDAYEFSDRNRLTASQGVFILSSASPAHFAVLAEYIMTGSATFTFLNAATSPVVQSQGYEALNPSPNLKPQFQIPPFGSLISAANSLNNFIALCNTLHLNEAIVAILPAYKQCLDLASKYDIRSNTTSESDSESHSQSDENSNGSLEEGGMMPWGALGQHLSMKNEDIWDMIPSSIQSSMLSISSAVSAATTSTSTSSTTTTPRSQTAVEVACISDDGKHGAHAVMIEDVRTSWV